MTIINMKIPCKTLQWCTCDHFPPPQLATLGAVTGCQAKGEICQSIKTPDDGNEIDVDLTWAWTLSVTGLGKPELVVIFETEDKCHDFSTETLKVFSCMSKLGDPSKQIFS